MVKTIRTSSIIICLFSWFIWAGNDEELFLRANKMYVSQEYDQALASYEMMVHKGRAVLYNIGNCYFHKNNYAQALVYWERAKRGATPAEYACISYNKNYVLEKLHKTNTHSFYHKIREWVFFVYLYVSPFLLQVLFFLLWGILLFLYYNGRLRIIRILLIVALVILSCIMFVHHVERSATYGIITKKRTELYSGPDKGFDAIGSVEYADSVIIKQNRQGWYKVRSFDTIGWVEASAIEII